MAPFTEKENHWKRSKLMGGYYGPSLETEFNYTWKESADVDLEIRCGSWSFRGEIWVGDTHFEVIINLGKCLFTGWKILSQSLHCSELQVFYCVCACVHLIIHWKAKMVRSIRHCWRIKINGMWSCLWILRCRGSVRCGGSDDGNRGGREVVRPVVETVST